MRRLLPLALTASFAAWSYWPAVDSVPGWGTDPLLSIWTLELVWHRLSTLGPLRIFSLPFWSGPLYGGAALGLAYSENELVAALLWWPLRLATGNGAFAMGIAAMLLTLAAFACAAGWLRAVGVGRLCFWGGALFACCGWIQTQYTHFQNLCIFVLPLALWAWAAFARRPSLVRALLCGAAFGWIGGWNLHFQVFAGACLAVLVALHFRTLPRPLLFAACACALFLQWPIASKYLSLSATLGSYHSLKTYGATWLSVLGSGQRPRLFLPSAEVGVEAAGYLGVPWLALLLLSLRRPAARPWVAAAAVAVWVSLGAGYGLFDAAALIPGVDALRATGRVQVLVILFTLPAVLNLLEAAAPRWTAAALGLVALDLAPASAARRVHVDPALWGPPTALSRELSRSDDPILVLPDAGAEVMLALIQSWTPYYSGLSSRIPAGEELLRNVTNSRPWTPRSLDDALLLTRARRVLAVNPAMQAEARASPHLALRSCFRHLDLGEVCLFDAKPLEAAELRIDRDAVFRPLAGARWPSGEVVATARGALDIRALDRCRVNREARLFGLRFQHAFPLMGSALEGVRFSPGDRILHLEARQAIFRLPGASASFALECG